MIWCLWSAHHSTQTQLLRVILFFISQETPGKIVTYSGLSFSIGKLTPFGASQVTLVVKNPPANAGDLREAGWIPGLGRSPGEGNGNSLQYSGLENPMDRGSWWATVHGVARARYHWATDHSTVRKQLTDLNESPALWDWVPSEHLGLISQPLSVSLLWRLVYLGVKEGVRECR